MQTVSTGARTDKKSKDRGAYPKVARSRVLLREPEACAECNRIFISLYPLRSCADHEGLDEL